MILTIYEYFVDKYNVVHIQMLRAQRLKYPNSGIYFQDDFIQSLIFGTILFFHLFDNLRSIKYM
jgi:hypothetical protein